MYIGGYRNAKSNACKVSYYSGFKLKYIHETLLAKTPQPAYLSHNAYVASSILALQLHPNDRPMISLSCQKRLDKGNWGKKIMFFF